MLYLSLASACPLNSGSMAKFGDVGLSDIWGGAATDPLEPRNYLWHTIPNELSDFSVINHQEFAQ